MCQQYRMPAAVALLVASLVSPASADDIALARGKALVEANCSRCHAVGHNDVSKHPQAPAFRTLRDSYPIDALEEAFVEGIYVGHPDMPEFVADPEQVAAIIAYIGSLRE